MWLGPVHDPEVCTAIAVRLAADLPGSPHADRLENLLYLCAQELPTPFMYEMHDLSALLRGPQMK